MENERFEVKQANAIEMAASSSKMLQIDANSKENRRTLGRGHGPKATAPTGVCSSGVVATSLHDQNNPHISPTQVSLHSL
jgi:hypothetical protein